MIAYLDTSAVVKLLIDEPGSDAAERLWLAADTRVCVTVGQVEATAALGRARRTGRLSAVGVRRGVEQLAHLWESVAQLVVDDALASAACRVALAHELRGDDAVHLAAAIASADTFVAADRRLLAAAQAAGLAVADVAA
ncbi:MAG: type II toxin-antitoxin system VapC family toxin [Acidimicrobiales bacterium]